MSAGLWLAILGAGLATFLPGLGSAIGVGMTARAAAGVLSEDPDKFGRLFLLVALPGTQGFYGFIVALLVIIKVGLLGEVKPVDTIQGLQIFLSTIPVTMLGLFSAIHQGKVCTAGVEMAAKKPESSMQPVIYGGLVETYAVLGLLASIFLLLGIQI
ncbi:MAG TPA: V-type ATP synthase subunit K [Candidatus Hydrothermia bacterium]|nr:V-type ATP synthase subunit K [Candidatus Hydrothermae bacterium]MDD3649612.1 V-type ATP synthase subunit K [Candidatus Hydrothermia bacterium]HOK23522.1 V-type ATP synthase subunit K [Candidatus Hydrothermia bacterium]HOL24249.1 V-type ATP synthase subunit K [Candidatus Hydrothermia bacterium]HOP33103.1 V-type ATP synthase subunit K [Candidatus Hydrothermia bacterium]